LECLQIKLGQQINLQHLIHKILSKKEARVLGDADLGEVQQFTGEFIVTQKGTVDKDVFYVPKNLLDNFDGSTVFFIVTEEEAKQYKRD
jgi:hypothetical protein